MARRELTYYGGGRNRSRNRDRSRGRDRDRSRKNEASRRFSLPDWVMTAVSVAVAVGFALSWAARWIHPSDYGFMSAAGLLAPALFAANFLCLLYWVIRWRWGVFIPLAVFAAGIWGMSLFFRPVLTRDYGDPVPDRQLVKVMTYNVQGMRAGMDEVIGVVDSLRPDILCLQEFQSTRRHPASEFEEALPAYHSKRLRLEVGSSADDLGWGNAIYSKYPISGSGFMDFKGTSNSVLWADVVVNRDTVRIYCAHLQTTSITHDDRRYIEEGDFVGDDTRGHKVRRLVGKLTRNYVIRASQADSLAGDIASSPHPVIVCGDFNDTPSSYSYHRIGKGLRDAFREAGRGYGYTFRGFFNLLRIDYILHSRDFRCVEYSSLPFESSDHNPVMARIRMR